MADASDSGEPLPLLELTEPLPAVTDTADALAAVAERFSAGTGPIAIDAERASGYRYSARAYLIQLRRAGAGTALVDPTPFEDLSSIQQAFGGAEWILHAATQDLPCLREVGLTPTSIFDTELAARLLGYPRVGLAPLVQRVLGLRMRKEHSAADWSTRPLPESWLDYAALDVEPLFALREHMVGDLEAQEKTEWARQEFEHLLDFEPVVRTDPWRRTSGMHRARGRRTIGAIKELWEARDRIAQERDVTPGRLIPDSAIMAAASALPRDRRSLMGLEGFHGRGASRYATVWLDALERARTMPESELPPPSLRSEGPPPARVWKDRDPEAAARLTAARTLLAELGGQRDVPVENLCTPEVVRRALWQPPADLEGFLREQGARPWQVELVAPLLSRAIADPASVPPPLPAEAQPADNQAPRHPPTASGPAAGGS